MEVGADHLAGERQTAEFDVDSMKVVWAGSPHALDVSDRMARFVASDPVRPPPLSLCFLVLLVSFFFGYFV